LGYALGAVIAQEFNDRIYPIAFHSRSLLPAKKNYDTHNKELATIIFGFKCGCPLFLGATHPIEVCTNHKNLQYFCQPQKITGCQAHWIEYLQDFNYKLTHILGHTNTVVDLLSWRKDLNKEVNTDKPCILLDNTLFLTPEPMIWKLFLKDNIEKRRAVLCEIHDSPTGGHPGISNTWELMKQSYNRPRLWEFVEEYVKGCSKCQESKTNLPHKKAPLQRFDMHVEQGPFQYMSMDLITDLPLSDGFDSIFSIVDQGCLKATKFVPCLKKINGTESACLYMKHILLFFGLP
jgi:RNase H-like domain found in reverse transcriptase/Integrase zinc binding domain